jgi:hypothetical protein
VLLRKNFVLLKQGLFFDDPIVKEGIVLRFVSGNFQEIQKVPLHNPHHTSVKISS